MPRFHRRLATAVAVLAGLVWSWFDMKTYTGPESRPATLGRIAAFAVMAGLGVLPPAPCGEVIPGTTSVNGHYMFVGLFSAADASVHRAVPSPPAPASGLTASRVRR